MNKTEIKALAKKHGVKKPMLKGDYSEAFYAFAEELLFESNDDVASEQLLSVKRLLNRKESERLKGKGKGTITTVELSAALNGGDND